MEYHSKLEHIKEFKVHLAKIKISQIMYICLNLKIILGVYIKHQANLHQEEPILMFGMMLHICMFMEECRKVKR